MGEVGDDGEEVGELFVFAVVALGEPTMLGCKQPVSDAKTRVASKSSEFIFRRFENMDNPLYPIIFSFFDATNYR